MNEIEELNRQLSEDNDSVEKTLTQVTQAIDKINENYDKIKTYLQTQAIKTKNPFAKKYYLKIETLINKNQANNLDINAGIQEETRKNNTKVYQPLYELPQKEDISTPEATPTEQTEAKKQ